MRAERLTGLGVRNFQRAAARWVPCLWLGGTLCAFPLFVWFGIPERIYGPSRVAAPTLLTEMVLFPGLQVARLAAFKLGLLVNASPGHPDGELWLPGFAVVLSGFTITLLFWCVLVPWIVTAGRVYVWPYGTDSHRGA